jgi:thiamine-phosphate pyrophosphorylase
VGQGPALGFSSHSAAEARARLAEGYDYCVLGPVYPTPEKLKYGPPLGCEAVAETTDAGDRLVIIGGIDGGNLAEVLALGGQRIAVISAIQRRADPAAAAQELRQAIVAAEAERLSRARV